jgi:hypothetical protein
LRFDFSVDLMHTSGMVWEGWQKLTIFHPTQGAQTTGSAMSYAEKLMMRTTFSVATSEDDVDSGNSGFQGNMRRAEPAPRPVAAPKRLNPTPIKPVQAKPAPVQQAPEPGPEPEPVVNDGEASPLAWTNFNEEPDLRTGEPRYNLDPLPEAQPVVDPAAPSQPVISLPEGLAELSEVTGLPVITADRAAQAGRGEIISHILLTFLPNALTEEELVSYWKDNHDALTSLKAVDLGAHNKIVLAFRDRRAEITAANSDG